MRIEFYRNACFPGKLWTHGIRRLGTRSLQGVYHGFCLFYRNNTIVLAKHRVLLLSRFFCKKCNPFWEKVRNQNNRRSPKGECRV